MNRIELNRTEPNQIEPNRISSIEPNRIFSIFRFFFEFGSVGEKSSRVSLYKFTDF